MSVSMAAPCLHGLRLPMLVVASAAAISGVSNFVNYWAAAQASPDAFLAVRNGLVALLLVPVAFVAVRGGGFRGLPPRRWAELLVIGLVGGAVPFLLYFEGLKMAGSAGAATASFGYRTLFLMAAVLAALFLREKVSRRVWIAAVLILGGNALLLSVTAPVWTDGTALVLLATAMWSAEYTISKHALRDVPAGTVALGRMGFGAVFLLAYVAATGRVGAIAALGPAQLAWVGISAAILFAFVGAWYAGLRHADLSVASAVLTLAFPVTWALTAFAGRAPVTVGQAAGFAVAVIGVVLAAGAATMRDGWSSGVARVLRARVEAR